MKYTPQIVTRKDTVGNIHSVTIEYDELDSSYVASVMSRRHSQLILAIGFGAHACEAADAAIKEFNETKN